MYTGDATAAIEAVRQAAAEDGWRMVPDEASPDMYDVGEAVLDNKGHIGDAYRAMLADPTAQFELDK